MFEKITTADVRAAQYLKPGVKLEPLVGRWYAFSLTIGPVQQALYLANRHLPLLESFVASPSVHVAASKDPTLYGGAFVDLETSDVPEVRDLLAATKIRSEAFMQLSQALKSVEETLKTSADGRGLGGLYAKLPSSLQGVAEFSYDASNRPGMRIRETLLYADPGLQAADQEILLYEAPDNDRKFFLNTPRLNSLPRSLFLRLSFADAGVDAVARARLSPTTAVDLARAVGLPEGEADRLEPFLTEEAPERRQPNFDGSDVRVRYFGHACTLVQTDEVSILIDPTFAYERDDDLATLTLADLPDRIDYVVISHAHQDHFSAEALLQIRNKIGVVVVPRNNPGHITDPSMKLILQQLGFADVRALDELDCIALPQGRMLSLPFPGEHSDLDIQSKHCVAITLKGRTLVFLVDSDAVDAALYERLAGIVGPVEALFIGMECVGAPLTWMYGPLLLGAVSRAADQSRRGNGSDSKRAMSVVDALQPNRVFVYAMGLEPWNRYLLGLENAETSLQMTESANFVEQCNASGRQAVRLKGCCEMLL